MTTSLLTAASVVLVIQVAVAVQLILALRRTRTLDERVAQYGSGLSLLTETAESGFRTMAAEIERLGATVTPRTRARATTARVADAVRLGHSIQEIAAVEEVSEAEVRLRLHLAEASAAESTGAVQRKKGKATPRAGAPRAADAAAAALVAEVARPARRRMKANGSMRA